MNATADAGTRPVAKAYPIRGTLHDATRVADEHGKPQLHGTIDYVKADGTPMRAKASAVGAAVAAVEDVWHDGPVEVYGTFVAGNLRVIAKAFPKEAAR